MDHDSNVPARLLPCNTCPSQYEDRYDRVWRWLSTLPSWASTTPSEVSLMQPLTGNIRSASNCRGAPLPSTRRDSDSPPLLARKALHRSASRPAAEKGGGSRASRPASAVKEHGLLSTLDVLDRRRRRQLRATVTLSPSKEQVSMNGGSNSPRRHRHRLQPAAASRLKSSATRTTPPPGSRLTLRQPFGTVRGARGSRIQFPAEGDLKFNGLDFLDRKIVAQLDQTDDVTSYRSSNWAPATEAKAPILEDNGHNPSENSLGQEQASILGAELFVTTGPVSVTDNSPIERREPDVSGTINYETPLRNHLYDMHSTLDPSKSDDTGHHAASLGLIDQNAAPLCAGASEEIIPFVSYCSVDFRTVEQADVATAPFYLPTYFPDPVEEQSRIEGLPFTEWSIASPAFRWRASRP